MPEERTLLLGLIQRSGSLLVTFDPVQKRPTLYSDLGHTCIALLEAAQAIGQADPEGAERFAVYARRIAHHLVQNRDMNGDGRVGWGLDRPYTDLNTHVTIPADQEYLFQTALAGRCLLDAFERWHDPSYLEAARAAVATFWDLRTTQVDPQCGDCAYYWYSTHPNYFGRLVKNTNVLFGMVLARLARLTGNPTYRGRALQVWNAERYEIDVRRNFGYFGANERQFRQRVDSHTALELWAFEAMSLDLGLDARKAMLALLDFFWRCGDRCDGDVTKAEGVAVGCRFGDYDETPWTHCRQSVRHFSPPNPNPRVYHFALAGVAHAYSRQLGGRR